MCLISAYAATQDRKLNHPNLLKDKIFHLKKFLKKDEYFSLVKLLNSKEINKHVSNLLPFHYDKLHSNCNSNKENSKKIELDSMSLNPFNSLLIQFKIKTI